MMNVNELETFIARTARCGMTDGTVMVIEYVSGFEKFGSYESWGQGWRVHGLGVCVEDKHLLTAVTLWRDAVGCKRDGIAIKPHMDLAKWTRDGQPYRAGSVLDDWIKPAEVAK
jgi:hypothetical protein